MITEMRIAGVTWIGFSSMIDSLVGFHEKIQDVKIIGRGYRKFKNLRSSFSAVTWTFTHDYLNTLFWALPWNTSVWEIQA